MAEYLVQGKTLTNIADKIRVLNGVEGALTTAQMDSNLGEANADVSTEADLIAQIASALEGKAGGGSSVETATVNIVNSTGGTFRLHYTSVNGNVMTDNSGQITIVIPSYCIAISLDGGMGSSSYIGNTEIVWSTSSVVIFDISGDSTLTLTPIAYAGAE